MKPCSKSLVLVFGGLMMAGLAALSLIGVREPGGLAPRREQHAPTLRQESGPSRDPEGNVQTSGAVDSALAAALAETDPERRQERLRQWADSIGTGAMEQTLLGLAWSKDPGMRSDACQALLSSWADRDMPGLAGWFAARNAADALHQQARDALVWNFGQRDPSGMFAWMEKTQPESVRHELYAPFFRQWAGTDPAAAAAKLRQQAEASPEKAAFWNDLIGQIAAQWAQADLNGALAWTQALPKGEAKARALEQVAYLWAESDPQAAAACAARENNAALYKAVASTWAMKDPASAAAWALRLPAGEGKDSAAAGVAALWAQKEPAAAATYANSLPEGGARHQARIAVAAMWADADAPKAAQWVEQFPEGFTREQALTQVIRAWAGANAKDAGQWLQRLPQTRSRDAAVTAFCGVIGGTDPAISFKWAETIQDQEIRQQQLEQTASSWLRKNPADARKAIAQSSLSVALKKQLLGSVPQNGI
jgi:hypothetical protein